MPLLSSLIDCLPIEDTAWLVLFDDDATFARPGRTRFLDVASRAGFDIAQPAIDPGQPHTFSLTLSRFLSIARRTTYVEVGPVVALSPRGRRAVLPFPPTARMGWGVDIAWATIAAREGLSLGIVDAEPILHHGPVGIAYNQDLEHSLAESALAAGGFSSLDELLRWIEPRWPLWRRNPPWDSGRKST
jgi:hypothetical protein